MYEMHPPMRLRLGHPKQRPLDLLRRGLFEVDEAKEQFIFHRWQGRIRIATVRPHLARRILKGLSRHR